jgi:hypothetical protein
MSTDPSIEEDAPKKETGIPLLLIPRRPQFLDQRGNKTHELAKVIPRRPQFLEESPNKSARKNNDKKRLRESSLAEMKMEDGMKHFKSNQATSTSPAMHHPPYNSAPWMGSYNLHAEAERAMVQANTLQFAPPPPPPIYLNSHPPSIICTNNNYGKRSYDSRVLANHPPPPPRPPIIHNPYNKSNRSCDPRHLQVRQERIGQMLKRPQSQDERGKLEYINHAPSEPRGVPGAQLASFDEQKVAPPEMDAPIANTTRPKERKSKAKKFPHKLHHMITVLNSEDKSPVIWLPHGRAFVIIDRERFMEVLPQFFKTTKMRSFTRQLNLWGFEK